MKEQIADLALAKAMANPVRQRILRELETLGEGTATMLAAKIGTTTGGTSYNLRVLAEHGLVEEVPERARGRERWWRASRRWIRFPVRSEQSPELREALDRLNGLWVAEDVAVFERFLRTRARMGRWSDAVPYSRGTIQVTPGELRAFFEEYLALLERYQRAPEETPADARTVLTRFIAFPEPEEEPADD